MPIRNNWWSFTIDCIRKVPEEAGVYELGNAKQDVVYIGSATKSIQSRLKSHIKAKKCIRVKYFRYRRIKWNENAKEEERRLIKAHIRIHGEPPSLVEKSPKNTRSPFAPFF
jgi:excinuclease UvrABC nuclease subunit